MSSGDIKLISVLMTDIWYSTLRGPITLWGQRGGQWRGGPGQPLRNSPADKGALHCHPQCCWSHSPDRTEQVSISYNNAVPIPVIFIQLIQDLPTEWYAGYRKFLNINTFRLLCFSFKTAGLNERRQKYKLFQVSWVNFPVKPLRCATRWEHFTFAVFSILCNEVL